MELRHGYTIADLHALARLAVHTANASTGADWRDRYDTAWSAVAEHLYAAGEWPTRRDLIRAGQLAILDAVDDHRQAYGFYKRKTDGGLHGVGSSPAFRTYWWDICGALPSPSPEHRIVERTALAQILPMLTPAMREALAALAVHDDYQAAADAIGATYVTFKSTIARARNRFRAFWHEGEIPSKPWGTDRRVGSYAKGRAEGRRPIGAVLGMRTGYPRTRAAAKAADRGEAS